jgi:hypothetical protein
MKRGAYRGMIFLAGVMCTLLFVLVASMLQAYIGAQPSSNFCKSISGRSSVLSTEERAASYCECQVVTRHADLVTMKDFDGRIIDITNSSPSNVSYYDNCRMKELPRL